MSAYRSSTTGKKYHSFVTSAVLLVLHTHNNTDSNKHNPSAYCLNYAVDAGQCSHYKPKIKLCKTNYNLPKTHKHAARFPLDDKCFIDAFVLSFSVTLRQSCRRQ